VLPHHLKTDEIARMAAATPLKLIAFAHLGCSFIETTCTLLHQAGEKLNFGIPCRARWTLPATGQKIPITHMAEDCSICRLPMLVKAGVQSLKIIGRELNPQFIASLTKTYVNALDEFEKGKTVDDVMRNVKSQQPYWSKSYCEPKRCKYMYTLYYV
jgi:collagenase-like PrtC family protease